MAIEEFAAFPASTAHHSVIRLEDSMCELVARAKEGEEDAASRIWDHYFPQLVSLAGTPLHGQRCQVAGGADVATTVLESLFQAARAGRLPNLHDSDGIWRLLSQITRRKVIAHVRKNAARPILGESALGSDAGVAHPLATLAGGHPTPAMVAIIADEIERLLEVLPEKYQAVALKKLECLTAPEIAERCGVHVSTVEGRLRIIQCFWAKEFFEDKGR